MRINGREVSEEEIERELAHLWQLRRQENSPLGPSDEELQEMARNRIIEKILLEQEAERRVPKISEEELEREYQGLLRRNGGREALLKARGLGEEDAPLREEFRQSLGIQKLYGMLFKGLEKVSQNEMQEEYRLNPEAYGIPEMVHCSHIVRHTYGEADPSVAMQQILAAQSDLKQGMDFRAVAEKYSDCNGQAGDLGTFPRGRMVESFDQVVFRMEAGSLSDIFKTEFGYHIVLLHEKFPGKALPFEEVKGKISEVLANRKKNEAITSLLERLKASMVLD